MDKNEILKSVDKMIVHCNEQIDENILLFYIWFRKYDDYGWRDKKLTNKCLFLCKTFINFENNYVIRKYELLKLKNNIFDDSQ